MALFNALPFLKLAVIAHAHPGDGIIDAADLAVILARWGSVPS